MWMRLPGPPGRWPIPLGAAVALTLLSACSALGGAGLSGSTPGSGTTGTVKMQTFPVPTASSDLANIAAGPDGSLWFTEQGANKVGRITTAGQVTEYPIPNNASGLSDSGPTGIAESGGAMWFLTDLGESVYRITSGGTYTQVYSQDLYPASNLAPSSSGGVWLMMSHGDGFAQDGDAFNAAYTGGYDGIGRIDPATGHVELATTDPYVATDIAFGSDGALWFVDRNHNVIGRISVNGPPF